MDIGDPIKTTVEELRKVLNIENVVGKPIETEDKIVIPVVRMGMAFGAGMGQGKAPTERGEGTGAGAGGGAGIMPIAVIVVFKGLEGPEGVKVMSLKNPNHLAQVLGEVGSSIMGVMQEGRKMREKPKTKETAAKKE